MTGEILVEHGPGWKSADDLQMSRRLIHKITSFVLSILFYQAPRFHYSVDEIKEYEKLYAMAKTDSEAMNYSSTYPKYRFIQYVSETKNVVIHGSNNKHIREFEPRRQTMYNGEITQSVFATKDGIWPVFYAILVKQQILMNFRNGSINTGRNTNRYHYYSLDRLTNNSWTPGMVYFLPDETFSCKSHGVIIFEEWTSELPVKPLFKLEVDPEDFYFLDKVAIHKGKESMVRTWLFYKLRTKRG